MNLQEWITYGIENGWCSPPVCYMHDGLPVTAAEDEEMCEGHDPCIHIMRMYEDKEMALAVEEHCSPAVWRKFPYQDGDPF
jgi:hypothetical protein